jgi:hypothetical protein
MIRIIVDFNSMMQDPEERVQINVVTQPELLEVLRPGLRILLCDTDLETEGVVEFDEELQIWLAMPDWSTQRDI